LEPIEVDLYAYEAAVGPKTGKKIAKYLQGRSDKACAVATAPEPGLHKRVLVTASADLVAPHGVFLR
jgi:hypothetical protein